MEQVLELLLEKLSVTSQNSFYTNNEVEANKLHRGK